MSAEPFHNVMFGVSHVHVPVVDVARAANFYTTGMGFQVRCRGTGWVDIDGSSLLIRLAETPRVEAPAVLRIQVTHPDLAFQALLKAGASKLYEMTRTDDLELMSAVKDPDGNVIIFWRPLTEDEYGYLPNLPVETAWSPAAEALLKSLLLSVPTLFRALARRRVVRLAEELFPKRAISETDVVRAYILACAKITRNRLREPLARHGFNPDNYRKEFEAE